MEDVNKTAESSEEQNTKKPVHQVKTEMYWWLNFRRSFFIGDEYKIKLEAIDRKSNSVKIVITNLKNPDRPLSSKDKFAIWSSLVEDDKSMKDLLAPFAGE